MQSNLLGGMSAQSHSQYMQELKAEQAEQAEKAKTSLTALEALGRAIETVYNGGRYNDVQLGGNPHAEMSHHLNMLMLKESFQAFKLD